MKTSLILLAVGLISLSACQPSVEVAPHEDVTALQERFQGKYKPILSTSSEALDVDLDGKASDDMLEEISELSEMVIEIILSGKNQYNPDPSFLFVHHWAKQWLGREEPTSYDPSIKPSYDRTVVTWYFAFDRDLTQLLLKPQPSDLTDPDLYTPPQAVKIKENNRVEVTLTKRLYTTAGWKTVQIVTLYERFTGE